MVGPVTAVRQVVRRDDLRAELAAEDTSVDRAQELCDTLSAALAAAMLEPELRELVESELHFHVRGAAWWSDVIRDHGHPTLGAATAPQVTAALDSPTTDEELPPKLAAWRQECPEALMAAHMIFSALPKLAELGDATAWPAADARGVVRTDADGKHLALLDVLALGIPPPPVQVEPERRDGRIAARGALQARAVASETVDMLVPGTALLPGMPVPGFSRSLQPRLLPAVGNERIPPWGPLYLADAAGIPTASRGRGGPAPLAQRLAVEMMLAVPRGARANHPDGGRYSLTLTYRDLARAIWPRGRRGKTWNRKTDWPALWKAMIAVNGCGIPYHDEGTTGVWFPVTVEGGPRVFAVTGPDGTAAPPPLETEVRFTVTLPPDGGRGPLIHIPTMREYGYSAPAYRAYLGPVLVLGPGAAPLGLPAGRDAGPQHSEAGLRAAHPARPRGALLPEPGGRERERVPGSAERCADRARADGTTRVAGHPSRAGRLAAAPRQRGACPPGPDRVRRAGTGKGLR